MKSHMHVSFNRLKFPAKKLECVYHVNKHNVRSSRDTTTLSGYKTLIRMHYTSKQMPDLIAVTTRT